MKFLVLVLSIAAAVFADVSHLTGGYHYKPPTTSYGVPLDNNHGESAHQHHHVAAVPSGSYLPANLQVPLADSQVNFLTGGRNEHYGYNPQLIQDQKHVYYYAAPDEEEHTRLRIHITPNNQKNTNVIFVKAPTYGHLIPEVIAHPSQAEEKTKVFVLVKKPDQPAPISITAPAPAKVKPEVYVVKYKDQHEAEQVLSGGRGGQPLGTNVHHIGDEASFIKVLQSDSNVHVPHNDKYSGFDGNIDVFNTRSGIGSGHVYGYPSGSSHVGSGSSGFTTLRGSFGNQGAVEGSSLLGSTTGATDEGVRQGSFSFTSSTPTGGNVQRGGSVDVTLIGGGSSKGDASGSSVSVGGGSGENTGKVGLFGFTSSVPTTTGSVEFSSVGGGSTQDGSSDFGSSSGSHVSSSLDTLKIGDAGKTSFTIGSSGSNDGSSLVSGTSSTDSGKSGSQGGSFTSTFEYTSSNKNGKEYSSPLLTSLTGGSLKNGFSSSSFEISGSKGVTGSGSLQGRLSEGADATSGSSLSGSVSGGSVGFSSYGPPPSGGPY